MREEDLSLGSIYISDASLLETANAIIALAAILTSHLDVAYLCLGLNVLLCLKGEIKNGIQSLWNKLTQK
ncbi:MAG: hypothetical protein QIT35_gp48 [Methanophagales virus PBV299]|uniref:Uncharacterized protein n=1 Tax=Methanophagales virus PBV299 TaxID=2987730 RepID=A0ABY6GLU8_9CAUD|nr:MAG: hypothetical protein QIT35_gp48 [Methanophagales virus PBV299]UYL64844.1 MAG: hypothetical protein OFDIEDLO_00048 [Methanophagales virus PBV299]